jgi:hypothetical protein
MIENRGWKDSTDFYLHLRMSAIICVKEKS